MQGQINSTDHGRCPYVASAVKSPLLPEVPASAFLQTWRWVTSPVEFLSRCESQHGRIFVLRLLGERFVVLSDPEAAATVLSWKPEQAYAQKSARFWELLGTSSLLLLSGKEHLRVRRIVSGALVGARVRAQRMIMLDQTNRLIDEWPLYTPFRVQHQMQELTMRISLRTIFGADDPALLASLHWCFTESLRLLAQPGALAPLGLQRYLGAFAPWPRVLRLIQEADRTIFAEIRRRRAVGPSLVDDGSVLSYLIDSRGADGPPLSDQEIRDQLMTLVVAGRDTTATALSWTFEYLLRHPRIWHQLTDELRNASSCGRLDEEQVAHLPWLNAVICESLRLQPVFLLTPRQLQERQYLLGYELPAGTEVAPCMYLTHRNPEVFPSPESFLPGRFLDRRTGPGQYFPFGGGFRRCVGMRSALQLIRLVLAATLSRTVLVPLTNASAVPVRKLVTLAPSGEVPVVLEHREPRHFPWLA